ncbi:hypothetical protein JTE90_009037 [Oedothorax gibbosus]|uniref:Uncharacterized protein n=1 Tax=Oedothorax gibbosus TaxID=931172 RepID=A0AAV6VJT1_9ARAC|nr:hypothetical protein JTE90_009037 [Oedothorax gibbosus]
MSLLGKKIINLTFELVAKPPGSNRHKATPSRIFMSLNPLKKSKKQNRTKKRGCREKKSDTHLGMEPHSAQKCRLLNTKEESGNSRGSFRGRWQQPPAIQVKVFENNCTLWFVLKGLQPSNIISPLASKKNPVFFKRLVFHPLSISQMRYIN